MRKKFKWGITGTGGIANAFANDLKHLENHVVESVLSRNADTAKSFAIKHGGCKPYNKDKLFFNDSELPAITPLLHKLSFNSSLFASLCSTIFKSSLLFVISLP